jgi:DNA polymerase IV
MRTIVHVDLDAFYSAIEQRDNPSLRGKPVIVGGDPDGRGVVATASYEARKYGVGSAMPCRTARRLCPHGIFVRPNFEKYGEVSKTIMDLLRGVTPVIETMSYDEAFLDASETPFATDPRGSGVRLKKRILEVTQLTASVGIAANRITAKIASDFEKPDGLTVVAPGEERRFLAPLPVRKLWGIGPIAEQRLQTAGIKTAGQLADAEERSLVALFGNQGLEWQNLARGQDHRPVSGRAPRRQVSQERTFATDVTDLEDLRKILAGMAHGVSQSLDDHPPCKTVTLKLRYSNFTTITRSHTGTSVVRPDSLREQVLRLLEDNWNGRPVRLLGVGVSNFLEEQPGQLPLL